MGLNIFNKNLLLQCFHNPQKFVLALLSTSFLMGVEYLAPENLNQSEISGDVSVHCPVPGSPAHV